MTDKEALKLALEWFKCYADKSMSRNNAEALADEVVDAIEKALAEHAMQEVQRLGQEIEQYKCTVLDDAHPNGVPLEKWGKSPQRKPLTEQEMFEAIRPLYSSEKAARLAVDHSEDEYRAIKAAHGIKENT